MIPSAECEPRPRTRHGRDADERHAAGPILRRRAVGDHGCRRAHARPGDAGTDPRQQHQAEGQRGLFSRGRGIGRHQDGDGVDSADHGGEDCFDTDPTVTDCGNADGTDGNADGGTDTAGADGSDGVTDDNTETDGGGKSSGCSTGAGSASLVGLGAGLLLLGARRRRS
jgi:hypothetical protein